MTKKLMLILLFIFIACDNQIENKNAMNLSSKTIYSTENSESIIDVVVAYLPSESQNISSRANNAISYTNTVFANSQISTRVRLSGILQLNFTGTNATNLLSSFRNAGNQANSFMNNFGADIGLMVTGDLMGENGAIQGRAYVTKAESKEDAYVLVSTNASDFNQTFAHEIAHILNAGHHNHSVKDIPITRNRGFVYKAVSGQEFQTIMSKDGHSNGTRYTRIPYFSSPNLSYNGIVIGSPDRNNRSAIAQHSRIVKNFREPAVQQFTNAPSNLQSPAQTRNTISLNWQDNNTNELGFNIYRNGINISSVEKNITTFTDINLNPNTNYSYFIRAYKYGAVSEKSNTITVKTKPAPVNFAINGPSSVPYKDRVNHYTYTLNITGSYSNIKWYLSNINGNYVYQPGMENHRSYTTNNNEYSFTIKVVIDGLTRYKFVRVAGSGGIDLP